MTVVLFGGAGSSGGPLTATTPFITTPGGLIAVYARGPRDLEADLVVEAIDADGAVASTAAAGAVLLDSDLPDSDESIYVARLPAPAASGDYVVRWTGPEPGQTADERLTVTVLPAWAPTLEDIAALSPAYTRGPLGSLGEQSAREHGFFDTTTNPTAGTVQGYIAAACGEVSGRAGVTIPARCFDLARTAAKWHAAATVEGERVPSSADEATGARSWKASSYVACLNELIAQARRGALRLS